MKKKLEAELISIAHRILKLKNRAELDQLQAETLKLYEKLSVLRFVEDNFSDVKPTIGYASAEGKLEEIYGIEETQEVHANEVEAKEEEKKKSPPAPEGGEPVDKQNKENESGEGITSAKDEGAAKPEGDADPGQKVEEYQASEEEKKNSPLTPEGGTEHTVKGDKKDEEPETDEKPEPVEEPSKEEKPEEIKEPEVKSPLTPEGGIKEPVKEEKEEAPEEPEQKIEVVKPVAEVKAMEESAAAVFDKEDDSTPEEEEKAADAEIVTIEPDASAKTEDSGLAFDFVFERKPAPETPQKQKEITFEDYHDYKEPEFVKKGEEKKEEPQQKQEEERREEKPADDWRNWEPSKPAEQDKPKIAELKQPELVAEAKPVDDWRSWQPAKQEEPKKPEPVAEAKPAAPRPLNDAFGKTISLGLNDRIAFEKNLFGGSSEDLNRVVSQINTQNSFDEAKAFIEDLVKPDYNNWSGKEEYEARFMELVEKRFS